MLVQYIHLIYVHNIIQITILLRIIERCYTYTKQVLKVADIIHWMICDSPYLF